MKRTKRQENAIVFQFVLNILLLLVFIFVFLMFILPKLIEISDLKSVSIDKYNMLQNINTKGLSFGEFKSESKKHLKESNNIYLKEILEELDEEFYLSHFKNESGNYKDFLSDKVEKYSDLSELKEKEKQISNILPLYSEKISDLSDNQLSDYKFINYIEKVLETFNLDYKNFIGINKTVSIEKFNTNLDNSLESGIYYIPLSFDISGSKRNILGFLYFIENVGNISIIDNEVIINNKNFYIKNKILDGDRKTSEYNIFNNQLADIQKITYKDDFDSSYTDEAGESDFIEYLMTYQGNEKFNIRVDVNFYIRGLASYKIKEYIENVIGDYDKLEKLLSNELKKKDYTNIQKDILLSHNTTLKNISKDINNIKKLLKKGQNLEDLYDNSSIYKNIISNILNDLEKQLGITMK